MVTLDDTERLSRDARAVHEESERIGSNVGALEFHDGPRDRLGARLAQADALLAAAYGVCGEGWRQLAPHMQDSYLWAVSDLIRAARGDLACMDDLLMRVEAVSQ